MVGRVRRHRCEQHMTGTRKILIDTDPGVDDAVAILMALASPELDVVGLTPIFGNAAADVTTRRITWVRFRKSTASTGWATLRSRLRVARRSSRERPSSSMARQLTAVAN